MHNYGDEIAEIIVTEGTSDAICTALHLCLFTPPEPPKKIVIQTHLPFERYMPHAMVGETIEKLRDTYKQQMMEHLETDDDSLYSSYEKNVEGDSPGCVICEYVMSVLDNQLSNNATEVSTQYLSFKFPFSVHMFAQISYVCDMRRLQRIDLLRLFDFPSISLILCCESDSERNRTIRTKFKWLQ